MRRMMLLALALALPTAALANSIDFTVNTANFSSGTNNTPIFGNPFRITLNGTNGNTISFHATIGSGCTAISTCNFSGGSVTATGPGVPGGNFMASLVNGSFGRLGSIVDPFTVSLAPNSMVASGTLSLSGLLSLGGSGSVSGLPSETLFTLTATPIEVTPVPEPSALELLGAGVIGLAGMARRKLRLGT